MEFEKTEEFQIELVKDLNNLEAIWNNILADKDSIEEAIFKMKSTYGYIPNIPEAQKYKGQ